MRGQEVNWLNMPLSFRSMKFLNISHVFKNIYNKYIHMFFKCLHHIETWRATILRGRGTGGARVRSPLLNRIYVLYCSTMTTSTTINDYFIPHVTSFPENGLLSPLFTAIYLKRPWAETGEKQPTDSPSCRGRSPTPTIVSSAVSSPQLRGRAAEARRDGAGGGLRQRHHLLQRHRGLHVHVGREHTAAGTHTTGRQRFAPDSRARRMWQSVIGREHLHARPCSDSNRGGKSIYILLVKIEK